MALGRASLKRGRRHDRPWSQPERTRRRCWARGERAEADCAAARANGCTEERFTKISARRRRPLDVDARPALNALADFSTGLCALSIPAPPVRLRNRELNRAYEPHHRFSFRPSIARPGQGPGRHCGRHARARHRRQRRHLQRRPRCAPSTAGESRRRSARLHPSERARLGDCQSDRRASRRSRHSATSRRSISRWSAWGNLVWSARASSADRISRSWACVLSGAACSTRPMTARGRRAPRCSPIASGPPRCRATRR